MTLNSNFVRFEVVSCTAYDADKKHVVFWWKCQECGCEYSTRSSGNVKPLCSKCARAKKDAMRKITFQRLKKRVASSVVSDIRNNLLDPKDLPSVTVDDEEYVSRKVIKQRVKELCLANQAEEEKNEKE